MAGEGKGRTQAVRNTAGQASERKAKAGAKLVCVEFCQVRKGGKVVTVDPGQEIRVTADMEYPQVCFREVLQVN